MRHMDSSSRPAGQPAEPETTAVAGLAAALRNRDYLRTWLAGICAGTMRWLEILAVGIYTLQETGSAFMVASMYFARTGPTLFCGPLAGAFSERVPRKPLLVCGLGLMAVVAGTLATLAALGEIELWHVACGAVVSGLVWSLEHTARRTIMRDVVPQSAVGNAISLDTGTQNLTRVIGPLAGGSLMALVGLQGAFGLAIVFYAAALVLIATIRTPLPATVARNVSVFGSTLAGLRYARSTPLVAAVLAVTIIMNMFGFPYLAMVPVIGRDMLHLDPTGIGVMMSAEGGGAVLGALALAVSVKRQYYTFILTFGCLTFALAIVSFSQQSSYAGAVFCLLIAGLGLGAFSTMQSTILLTAAEPAMRSRMMGLLVVAIGSGPLGVLLLGALSEWLGASTALSYTETTCVCLLLLAILRWRALIMPVP